MLNFAVQEIYHLCQNIYYERENLRYDQWLRIDAQQFKKIVKARMKNLGRKKHDFIM